MNEFTVVDYLPLLFRGALVTIQLTLFSAAFAVPIAFLLGLGRLAKVRLVRRATGVVVETFRGTSLLVQLFWLYYVLPLFGVSLPQMVVGVAAIALNAGAYGSEIVRSAIQAVPKGQIEAGIALNMTPLQRLRHIILPQAFVMMLPPFGNLLIELLKGTALVSLITIPDMTMQAMIIRAATMDLFKVFAVVLVLYFMIAYLLTMGVRWVERRVTVGRF